MSNDNIDEELRVRRCVEHYFFGLDARDRHSLEVCFADDLEVRQHTGTTGEFVMQGGSRFAEYVLGSMANYSYSLHVVGNCNVTITGDTAECITHVVANLVKGERIVVRGLRYTDLVVKRDGEWKLRRREHRPLWQYDNRLAERDVPAPALAMAAAQKK